MINLAINYSHQAAELVKNNIIEIDRFKCPDWVDLIAEASQYCSVAVHFELRAGAGKLHKADWDKILRLMKQTNTPYLNLHMNPSIKNYPDIPVDSTNPADIAFITEKIVGDINQAAQYVGAENVIVENVPYRGKAGKVVRPAVEIETIRNVIAETGCGLLLDISHARIAAHYMDLDEKEYISQLPVQQIKEIHFTGLHNIGGYLQDHLEILDSDFPVLKWAMEQIHQGKWSEPWLLAIEYGGVGPKFEWRSDKDIIAEQIPQVSRIVKSATFSS